MAGYMMRFLKKPLIGYITASRASLVFSCCLGFSSWACAIDNFSDPTRPPASIGKAEQGNVTPEVAGIVLQSVLISSGRRVAVISGQNVKLGEKFGDARVVKITESEVVLKNGKDTQILKLFPDIEKRRVSTKSRAKRDSRRQKTEGKE